MEPGEHGLGASGGEMGERAPGEGPAGLGRDRRVPGRGRELMASHELPPRPARSRSLKPIIAAALVLIASVGGLVVSVVYIAAPHSVWLLGSSGEISGVVRNSTGEAIQGARVGVMGLETFTNETGRFSLSGAPTGRQVIVVEAQGYRQLRFITLLGETPVSLSLVLKEGSGTEVVDEHPQQVNSFYTCGAITMVFSALALLGGLLALRRRSYTMALAGAMAGLAIPPFPVMAFLCMVAVVLLLFSRGEFS